VHQHLNPNDDINQIIPFLEDNCMYVGHLPHMEKLVSKLLCGNEGSRPVEFENAAVVCIALERGESRLQWMIRPSIL